MLVYNFSVVDEHNATIEIIITFDSLNQRWKFPQVRQFEADNFGGRPGTFCFYLPSI